MRSRFAALAVSPFLGIVVLLSATTAAPFPQTRLDPEKEEPWVDPSPHRVHFVEVNHGVRLEVLDWGGIGDSVVFLAGHGHTGHVFDELAPKLIDDFRVLAITRRGFGASSQPPDGYDLGRLVDDVERVTRELELDRIHLIGHSIAGDEMTRFAIAYPERVGRLVYLDAAYDRADADRLYEELTAVPAPSPTNDDLASPAAIRSFTARVSVRLPESEVRARRVFDADGRFVRFVTADAISDAVAKSVEHPAYERVPVPALAIYAISAEPEHLFPYYASLDRDAQASLERNLDLFLPWAAQQRERFRREIPSGRVVELVGASHYVFISHETVVLEEIRRFLLAE